MSVILNEVKDPVGWPQRKRATGLLLDPSLALRMTGGVVFVCGDHTGRSRTPTARPEVGPYRMVRTAALQSRRLLGMTFGH